MALAASANHAFRFTLEGKVAADLHEKIRALQREYNSHHHEIPGRGQRELPDRWDLTEFLVDRFAIAALGGLRGQVERAMDAARGSSDHRLRAGPRAFMRRWAREVADRVTV